MAKTPISPSLIQELQLWMPNGAQNQDNLPSLQEYIDMAIRQDGALHGALADCKTYNKVLYQLTRICAGFALFLNHFGQPARDAFTPENWRDAFIEALKLNVSETIDPAIPTMDNPGVFLDISYQDEDFLMDRQVPIGASIQILPYDVGRSTLLVYLEGVNIKKGLETDTSETPVWHEVGEPGTVSTEIGFKFVLPKGASIYIMRLGTLKYAGI